MSAGDVSNSEFVGSLYRDHRGWLLAWLNRNLGCRQRAEDLSQDTFVRLLGRPELPGLREPRAFLAKVARGLLID
ncbi:RNA polymerase subunit sigma, partial [Pseudomonas aeruginosa]